MNPFALLAAASAGVGAWLAARLVCGRLRCGGPSARGGMPALEDVFADRTLGFAVLGAFGAVFSAAVSLEALPACLLVAWALSRKMPALLERRRARELRSSCDGQLDALEDIVAMGVRAGLSFDAAIDIYCGRFAGELSREMTRARLAWKNGLTTRERALRDLADRIGSRALAQFAETSSQAIRYGSPLADMLEGLARDLREERRASIERQVAKAPVKMLVPTAVCILPATLILVLGPAFVQFLQSGF